MRKNFLLITLIAIPFVVKGQTSPHKTALYNKGKMYVGKTLDGTGNAISSDKYDESYVKLYIGGSATFATGSAVATEEESHIGLTGNLVSTVADNDPANHIFTSYVVSGDSISGAKGYLYFLNSTAANVTVPTIANPSGEAWNLGLKQKQTISMTSTDKENHYIALPAVRTGGDKTTNKGVYVAFDPTVAVALHKSSGVAGTNVGGAQASYGSLISIEGKYNTSAQRRIDLPQIIGSVNRIGDKSHTLDNAAFEGMSSIMHDIKLYDPTVTTAGAIGSNQTQTGVYAMTGFTPLGHASLYSDHMMFNILTRPTSRGILDGIGSPITSPKYEMKPGYGYFIAQNVIPDGSYYDDVEQETPGVLRANRAIGGYQFEREFFLNKRGFSQFSKTGVTLGTAASAPFEEGVVKGNTDVQVALEKGINYLANPFFGVLDLTPIITPTAKTTLSDWGGVSVGGDATADIRNKYWIVSNAEVKYYTVNGAPKLGFRASYYDSSAGGVGGVLGTTIVPSYPTEDPQSVLDLTDGYVGPMQMFCLQASTNTTITLPASKVIFKAGIPTTKSTASRIDEVLLRSEVLNDNDDVVFEDRLSLVLRDNASLASSDEIDTRKTLSNTSGNLKTAIGAKATDNSEAEADPFAGIMYTKTSDGLAMSTNAIPTSTHQMAVYFVPTEKEQRVRIKPFRTESWNSIERAWLYDKFEDKTVELTADAEYVFTSKPLAADLASENRFVLYFNEKPNGGDTVIDEDPISCYYNGSILYVDGLNENDLNSTLQIYDLQGRQMAKTTISNVPSMTYPKILNMGTYIVKITGKRNFTTKIVTLQN